MQSYNIPFDSSYEKILEKAYEKAHPDGTDEFSSSEIGLRLFGVWVRAATVLFLQNHYIKDVFPYRLRFLLRFVYDDIANMWGEGSIEAILNDEEQTSIYPILTQKYAPHILRFWNEDIIWNGPSSHHIHHKLYHREQYTWGYGDPIVKEFFFRYSKEGILFGDPFINLPVYIEKGVSIEEKIAVAIGSLDGASSSWEEHIRVYFISSSNWVQKVISAGDIDLIAALFPVHDGERIFITETDRLDPYLEEPMRNRLSWISHSLIDEVKSISYQHEELKNGWKERYSFPSFEEVEQDIEHLSRLSFLEDAPFANGVLCGEDLRNFVQRLYLANIARTVAPELRDQQKHMLLFLEETIPIMEYPNVEYLYSNINREEDAEFIYALKHLKSIVIDTELNVFRLLTSCPELCALDCYFPLSSDPLCSREEIEAYAQSITRAKEILEDEYWKKILPLLTSQENIQQGVMLMKTAIPTYKEDLELLFRINYVSEQYGLDNSDLRRINESQLNDLLNKEVKEQTETLNLEWENFFGRLEEYTLNPALIKEVSITTTIINGDLDLQAFVNLEKISLIGIPGLISINCTGLKKLQSLELRNNKHLESIHGLQTCTELRELIICGTKAKKKKEDDTFYVNYTDTPKSILSSFDPNISQQLCYLTKLETLDINVFFHESATTKIHYSGDFLPHLIHLKKLLLVFFVIEETPMPENCEEVDLSYCFLSDLSIFSECQKLQTLCIMWCTQINSCHITDLTSLPKIETLNNLIFQFLPALSSLEGIQNVPNVKRLYLRGLSNVTISKLKDHCMQLEILDMLGSNVKEPTNTPILLGDEIREVASRTPEIYTQNNAPTFDLQSEYESILTNLLAFSWDPNQFGDSPFTEL